MRDPIEREDALQAIMAEEIVDKSVVKRILMQIPSAFLCPEGFDPEHLTEQDKGDILDALDWVRGTITEEVPSAEPERKTGKWGKEGECPFCGYLRQWKDDKFCANCGAKMEDE